MKVGKLVFMVYTARSGSTLLASSLESLEEIGVTIEDKVPWGLGFLMNYIKMRTPLRQP